MTRRGTECDSLYETGSDSTTSAGTNIRQYAFSGGASDSSTYTTTFSVSGTDSGGFTETESDAPVYGTNDVITGGSSVETLTSTDSTTQTYTENGARTVSWGAGNFDEGSYSATETTTLSDSQYDSSSFGLGTNGTIASGTAISSTTTSYSDSESDLETGSEFVSDPAGGPALGGTYSQTSITTSYAYSVNRGAPSFGAGGVISGGGNTFTFLQNSSDSHNLNITTTSDVVTDSGYDTYSESMSGTETYGPGGTVSSGSDSFTWAQTASDNLILTQDYGGTTLGIYTLYDMTVDDQIYQNFSDVGNDILGPSDSILGGGDTFTWGSSRDLVSTITDYGQAATPYLILAYSSDQTGLNQTGSDTLTTNGHIYSTVTYTYNEQTSDNDSVSQSVSGTGWVREGSASDSYSDSDSGTITVSDTTTSSFDSFTVSDNHSISGGIAATATYSPGNAGWTEKGVDQNQLYASGTKSTTGDVYTFTDTESSTDNFVLNKTIPSSMNGVATDSTSDGSSMTGATSTGPSGSTFGYTETSQSTSQFDDGGNVTSGLVVTPITLSTTTSLALQIVLTGPIAATTTTTVGYSTTLTGGNDGANFTETVYAGEGSTAGTPVAALAGSSPDGSAEHQGTSPGGLDTSSGLLSALGGEGVHAMSFAGAEILPTANPTGTAFWLEESNQSGQTPTNWVSHPSGIGYSRGSSGIITSGSGSGSGSHSSTTGPPIAGNAPTMDSGTSDGGAGQELGRLGNFDSGGNENSTATQPGATPRAGQVAVPTLPGSPAGVSFQNTSDRDVLDDVMNDRRPGIWTPLINPFTQPESSRSSDPGVKRPGGPLGAQGYGTGGGGLTGPDGLVRGTGPESTPATPAAPPADPGPQKSPPKTEILELIQPVPDLSVPPFVENLQAKEQILKPFTDAIEEYDNTPQESAQPGQFIVPSFPPEFSPFALWDGLRAEFAANGDAIGFAYGARVNAPRKQEAEADVANREKLLANFGDPTNLDITKYMGARGQLYQKELGSLEAATRVQVDGILAGAKLTVDTVNVAALGAGVLGAVGRGGAAAAARSFTSPDPLVGQLATEIEALYPGHVLGVNVPLRNASGQLVTDADILLQNAVIQVKSGTHSSSLLQQLQKSEAVTGLPSVGYGPNLPRNAIRALSRQGGIVTDDRSLLLEVIKP